ncbi:E3 ubiquitin ligase BIG BROTHER-related [Platanthera zijinensis]|uniref:E3 ubiquitin ligase BIG BROTHER-related n=1 Tax=Platanthera zijinensis TaxID=2320716 RepID=A0AAP0BWY6_9ASPA
MEKAKESGGAGDKAPVENPHSNSSLLSAVLTDGGSAPEMPPHMPSRTPFTNLSHVDVDLALARALQEQERAYMIVRMEDGDDSDYGSSVEGSYTCVGRSIDFFSFFVTFFVSGE